MRPASLRLGIVPAFAFLGACSSGTPPGSGGAAGIGPVGTCDALPAAGTWENITPPGTSTKPAVNGTVGAAIIVSVVSWIGSWFIGPRGRVEVIRPRRD